MEFYTLLHIFPVISLANLTVLLYVMVFIMLPSGKRAGEFNYHIRLICVNHSRFQEGLVIADMRGVLPYSFFASSKQAIVKAATALYEAHSHTSIFPVAGGSTGNAPIPSRPV